MTVLNRLREGIPPQQDVGAERNRLLAEIRGESSVPVRLGPARPKVRLRRGLALAGAFGLAAAVTVTVARLDGGPKTPVTRPPVAAVQVSAASVLEKAALVAEKSKVVAWRPEQWFYLKKTQPGSPVLPVYELWTRMDGERQAVREADGKLRVGPGEKGPMNPAKTQRKIENLPSDPGAMLEHFREDADGMRFGRTICGDPSPPCPAGTEKDVEAYAALRWYMEYGPLIPPDKAAAMYRAMAMIPGIQLDENATTTEGRKGIGVVFDAGPGGKHYTILDPVDYRYLGVKDLTRSGRVVGGSVLASGLVDKPGETP
ncbi:CU044_5270 family protein [Microtetraspora sp. NBRC 13810]|uniref:CU044_5270 family protein n=1 Tax=Microtetraspora sp. NBRC 13810 TaxID=3030990 RepID=UPI0025525250|nr:CU044_5270 family protein [Microtetraspora sp. NBRC 13810]